MKIYHRFLLLMTGLLILTSCGNMTNEEIKNYQWKYGEGYHIGDVLLLDDHNLKGDTIFKDDKPVAVITTSGGMFWESSNLEIKAFKTGLMGTYHEMGKVKQRNIYQKH